MNVGLLLFRRLVFLAALGCAHAGEPPPLLLISMDGFRWDYCALHPAETPNLRALIREGTTAQSLIPVFPTNTFPNHYSIATGLRPARHGMINNEFSDPTSGDVFNYKNPAAVGAAKWWGGEPIWTTALRQGHPAASYFWVGSEAENHGVRPTFWKRYDYSVPFEKRLDELVAWFRLPPEKRPAFVAFYFEETNSAGHTYGPDSPELAAAVRLLDAQFGTLRTRLAAAGITPNFVIVSDHGMTPVSVDRVIVIDDFLDLKTVQIDFEGSVVGLQPVVGDAAGLVAQLARMPRAKACLAADLPRHFHLTGNSRIAPVWIVPELGWHVLTRKKYELARKKYNKGDHGYDPLEPTMHGIFIASGPSFKAGVVTAPVENIHIYNLLCAALRLQPAPNDGDDRLIRAVLR
jgi:predicted AlkP superfamily pyrophosphatase or phosphodiesterase